MYKFVLCVLLAVAVAEPEPEPGALFAPYAPLAYTSTYLSPATTTITKSASSVVHPSPYFYSNAYYPHFIKKRSAPFFASSYSYAPSTYIAPSPLLTSPYAAAPLLPSAPIYSSPLTYGAPAHFIKKRSVGLFPSTYIAPTTYAAPLPLAHTSYAAPAPILPSAPLYTSPFGYSHFIKKRSVGLLPTTYISPAYTATAPLLTSPYAAATPIVSRPYIAASPYGYTTYIKK